MVLEGAEMYIDPYSMTKSMKSLEKQLYKILRSGVPDDRSKELLRATAKALNRNFEMLMSDSNAAVEYFAFRPNALLGIGRAHDVLYKSLGEYTRRFSYERLMPEGLNFVAGIGVLSQPIMQWIEPTDENRSIAVSILGEMKDIVNDAVYARLGGRRQ